MVTKLNEALDSSSMLDPGSQAAKDAYKIMIALDKAHTLVNMFLNKHGDNVPSDFTKKMVDMEHKIRNSVDTLSDVIDWDDFLSSDITESKKLDKSSSLDIDKSTFEILKGIDALGDKVNDEYNKFSKSRRQDDKCEAYCSKLAKLGTQLDKMYKDLEKMRKE